MATPPAIPFLDLTRQIPAVKRDVADAVARVLASGVYVLGEEVRRFEAEFAAYCGAGHCVAVNSGTSALHLALLACGVGPGDEVVTTPFTFVATCEAILYTGANPVFVDIDPRRFTLDAARVEAAITPRTRAIVPVHLYGRPADLGAILATAARHSIPVIEDACQAHGARYGRRRIGSVGRVGCFSFYPTKNLGACGEAGAIVSDDTDVAERARALRHHGAAEDGRHRELGFNYRMEALQAAILRAKLPYLDEWIRRRQAHAALYDRLLGHEAPSGAEGVYHLYVVRHPQRDALRAHLARHGVDTRVHYPVPCHLEPVCAPLGYGPGAFPEAERAAAEVLSLPLYPQLEEAEIRRVTELFQTL